MVHQKINYVLIALFCVFLTITTKVSAQNYSSMQLGCFGGVGTVYSTLENKLGIDYRGGLNAILPFKKNKKIRFEMQLQYDWYFFRSSYYSNEDHKWRQGFNNEESCLNFNFLFHLPILYQKNYKLFIAPGTNLGLSIREHGGNPWFGLIASIKQEFKLTNQLILHLDINSLNQIFSASFLGSSSTIFNFIGAINVGLSW